MQESLYLLEQFHRIQTFRRLKYTRISSPDKWDISLSEQLIQLHIKNEDFVAAEHALLEILVLTPRTGANGRTVFLDQLRASRQLADLCVLFRKRVMEMDWESPWGTQKMDLDEAVSRSVLELAARIDNDHFSARVWVSSVHQEGPDLIPFALHASTIHNACHLAQRAVDGGVFIDAKSRGKTALHVATTHQHLEMMDILIANGADLEACDDEEETPIFEAAASGSTTLVARLLYHGADIEARNRLWRTPLHRAVNWQSAPVVKLLLSHGAEIDARDDEDQTPLHKAVTRQSAPVVELLLSHGAEIESRDYQDQTPLHMAVHIGSICLVKILTLKGADLGAEDIDSKNALTHARERGYEEIGDYLLRASSCDASAGDLIVKSTHEVPRASSASVWA
ncbi:MAG: hypothetical protein LQ348_000974 [Seirophora lacunosa]|nr:MAG: hypothetical protein LQ348_000974 [Seirophora lacunosa]